MQSDNEITIFIYEAAEGMIIARDIYSPDGTLIAKQGESLTADLIDTISGSHIMEIAVYDGIASSADEQTYFDRLQTTPEFKKFSDDYNKAVSLVNTALNSIAFHNKKTDIDALVNITDSILNKDRSAFQVFNMLQTLRRKDDLTCAHCLNVSIIASIIAQWIGLSKEDIRLISATGILHDVGKFLIPQEIIAKPDKLTNQEFNIIKTHVNLSFDLLKNQNIDSRIKEACLLHHEKSDGSGYPFKLKNDKIPLFAKIITIADVYDAMTTSRVYRGSMCPFTVIKQMEDDSFSKYDPNVLVPFLNKVVSSYLHSKVRLSDGSSGEVVLINNNCLSRPSVMCNGGFIDLSKRSDLTIKAIL